MLQYGHAEENPNLPDLWKAHEDPMSTAPRLQLKSGIAPEQEIGTMPSGHSSLELNTRVDEALETPIAWVIAGGILSYILLRLGLHVFYYIVAH